MNLDPSVILSYYSRLVMAKNQGHFKIASALLELIENASIEDTTSMEGRKALEKIAQAKGHSATIAAGVESTAEIPAGEAADWQNYVQNSFPYSRKMALALADYFKKAILLETAYEMYLAALELDEDGSSNEELSALKQVETGEMAMEFGKTAETNKNFTQAANWYKKAKDIGHQESEAAINRMQSVYGVTRFLAPWIEIAKKSGRKQLAQSILTLAENSNTKLAESITTDESLTPPCYEEIEFWEKELDAYEKFSNDKSEALGATYIAIGKILEQGKIYNQALRWFKKAVEFNSNANADARRMLPLKSKSSPLREAEDIYNIESLIPSLWKETK